MEVHVSFCHACGAGLVDGWAHCQSCGAATAAEPVAEATIVAVDEESPTEWPTPDEDAPVDEPGASPSSRWTRRRVLIGVAGAAGTALIVVTVLNILGTHDRLDKTRTTLASTKSDLEETQGALDRTHTELERTEQDLQTRTSERDTLRSDLTSSQQQLAAANISLSDARGKVDLQASVIEDLRYCLSGVADAAVYMADGYYGSAIDSLNRVESACQRASDSVV